MRSQVERIGEAMRAVVRDVYGSVDVLRIEEIATPVASEGEVLVRVLAAGVDQGVWHLMVGMPYVMRLAGFGLRAPKNPLLGCDLAGRVEAVGADAGPFQPGDEVFGTCPGSFAEYAVARADRLAEKPGELSFEQAAATPISGYAALQAVRDHGKVKAGQRVLIIGAGGGVGTFSVQIAKADRAEVTGVCGTAKTELVRSIGADHVIDYTKEDFADGPQPLRRDPRHRGQPPPLPTPPCADAARDARDRRRRRRRQLARYPASTTSGGALAVRPHRSSAFSSQSNGAMTWRSSRKLLETGAVRPVVDRTFPLDEVPQAISYLRSGQRAARSSSRPSSGEVGKATARFLPIPHPA